MPLRNSLLGQTLLLTGLLSAVGCVDIDNVDERSQSVLGGSPSSVDSVVRLNSGTCAAVAVTTKHVLTSSSCIAEGGMTILVGATPWSPDASVDVARVIEGPLVAALGTNRVYAILLETEEELPLTPATLAGGLPALDDIVTVVGYEDGIRNQGDLRVSEIEGPQFTVVGEGGILACDGDAPTFDHQGNLLGLGLFGTPGDTNGCWDTMTSVAVSSIADFLAESAGVELPDDGSNEDGDDGGGVDDGGGCNTSNGVPSNWTGLLLLGFLAWRRRRSEA